MTPLFNIGSLRKSPIVNRVRNIYRENTTDSALESLRMQSVNISHIRDLSTGLKSSSSDSSEEELDSYQRIDFPNRKRFHERRLQKTQSELTETAELQRNNTFSEYEKRKNKEESPRDPNDSFESPLDSEAEYRTPFQSQEELSPLELLMNYKQESDKENRKGVETFYEVQSPDASPISRKSLEKIEPEDESVTRAVTTPSIKDGGELDHLSYSFSKTCYVFRVCFEPKLSTVKETSFIPSRIIINKSPFIIGSDSSCDLVLPKRKFKFIAPKHCKITYQSSGTKIGQREGSPVKGEANLPREEEDIVPYRVKITKSSPSGTTYVNNSILRGTFYLGNGDLVSLGPRNNYLTFRMVFRTKKECHLLKSQLSISSQRSMSIDQESGEEEIETDREERLVPVDKINITGVKIFVFQIFNYSASFDFEEKNGVETGNGELNHSGGFGVNYQELGEVALEEEKVKGGLEAESENDGTNQPKSEDSEYFKLRSPVRSYKITKSPVPRVNREHHVKNIDSFKTEELLEVYSSSDRFTNNSDPSSSQNEPKEEEEETEGEKYWNKVQFLKSLAKNDFPIVIETNRSSLSRDTSPSRSKTSYKLIGIVDGSNNMSISEILMNIDQMVRSNIEENLENFQVVLKRYNKPVEREMLESSWVFQLEFLDTENPKIKRAIYKHDMFKENKENLEKILKDNKCRVMYIKTD